MNVIIFALHLRVSTHAQANDSLERAYIITFLVLRGCNTGTSEICLELLMTF